MNNNKQKYLLIFRVRLINHFKSQYTTRLQYSLDHNSINTE